MSVSLSIENNNHATYNLHVHHTYKDNTFHFVIKMNHYCLLKKFQSYIPDLIQNLNDRTPYTCSIPTQIPICNRHQLILNTTYPNCTITYQFHDCKYEAKFEMDDAHIQPIIDNLIELDNQITSLYTTYRELKTQELKSHLDQTGQPITRIMWEIREIAIPDVYKYLVIATGLATLLDNAEYSELIAWIREQLASHTINQLDLYLQGFGDINPRIFFDIFNKHKLLLSKINSKINYDNILEAWCKNGRLNNFDILTQKWIRVFQDFGTGTPNPRYFTCVLGLIAFKTGDYRRFP